MNGKVIGIFVCTLMIASGFASANVIKIENKTDNNVFESLTMSTLGETYLYPPWDHAGNHDEETSLCGSASAGVETDDTGGSMYGSILVGVNSLGMACPGSASTDTLFYHQTKIGEYFSPCDGYYDFKFKYSYDGFIDYEIFNVEPYLDSYIKDEIKITFIVFIDDTNENYEKELVIDEERRYDCIYKDWDNTKDITFSDIYVPEGSEVFFYAIFDIYLFGVASLYAVAAGSIVFHGSLQQIKIIDSCPSNPPNAPSRPSGKRKGGIDTLYTYTTSATDPDNDNVYYMWDWDANGGHDYSNWLGPYPSGQQISTKHSWDEQGEYYVRVKAKDEYDKESPWSSSLSVSIPKTKNLYSILGLFSRPMNLFPALTSILRNIL